MTADEMLNELGYRKSHDGTYLRYETKEDDIYIWCDEKTVHIYNASPLVLKAVTEKCRELGLLSKAEQMFMSMGYRKVEGEIYTRYEKRHEDRIPEYISFWQSDQTMNCSAKVNKALFDAMLQQSKELGWYE